MQAHAFRVAVVLVNYNSSGHTLRCVEAIRAHTSRPEQVQIVVVDNASRREEYAALAALEDVPRMQVLRSRLNTGFSGGNMLGVAAADAEFYYFLNNDCLFEEDCIERLLAHCDAHPEVSMCSGVQRHEAGGERLNFGYFPSLFVSLFGSGLARVFWPASYPSKNGPLTQALQVPLLAGCSMFVRANAFARVGGFDTNYFLYSEEEDLARRLSALGGRVELIPGAGFLHSGGGSTPDRPEYLREFYISHSYYLEKFHGRIRCRLHQLLLGLKLLRRSVRLAAFVLRGAPQRYSLRHAQRMLLEPPDPNQPVSCRESDRRPASVQFRDP